MKKAKKRILVAVFILGALFLLYPMVGSLINAINQLQVVNKYEDTVNLIDTSEADRMFEEAVKYNENVYRLQKADTRYTLAEDYEKVLMAESSGVMGYIEVPKANVKLPIYHGVEENVLQQGVGHVRESSLPIGTINQNSMLLGHSGVPNSKLFTELDRTKIGDLIKITVLRHELYYRIYDTKVVEPDDLVEELKVEEGRDLITLVTCVPYSVNSHRLVIHAERYNPEGVAEEFVTTANRPPVEWIILGCVAGGIIAVIINKRVARKKSKQKIVRHLAVQMATMKLSSRKKVKKKAAGKKRTAKKKKKSDTTAKSVKSAKMTKADKKMKTVKGTKAAKTAKTKNSKAVKKRGKK